MQADLRDPDACARVVDQTVDALGRLDVLVNMASVYRAVAFDDLTIEDWNEPLEVDLRAAWLCTQAAVPYMRRLRGGRVINISTGGRQRASTLSATCRRITAAKRAVIAPTEALALDCPVISSRQRDRPWADRGAGRHFRARVPRRRACNALGRGAARPRSKAVAALVEKRFITGKRFAWMAWTRSSQPSTFRTVAFRWRGRACEVPRASTKSNSRWWTCLMRSGSLKPWALFGVPSLDGFAERCRS
jgi:hypothetical protein